MKVFIPFGLLLLFVFTNVKCEDRTVVDTQSGKVRGLQEHSAINGVEFYSYKGVPFAQSPEGELRFRAPVPVTKWDGIRDATQYGDVCVTNGFVFQDPLEASENCLFLNIFVPGM